MSSIDSYQTMYSTKGDSDYGAPMKYQEASSDGNVVKMDLTKSNRSNFKTEGEEGDELIPSHMASDMETQVSQSDRLINMQPQIRGGPTVRSSTSGGMHCSSKSNQKGSKNRKHSRKRNRSRKSKSGGMHCSSKSNQKGSKNRKHSRKRNRSRKSKSGGMHCSSKSKKKRSKRKSDSRRKSGAGIRNSRFVTAILGPKKYSTIGADPMVKDPTNPSYRPPEFWKKLKAQEQAREWANTPEYGRESTLEELAKRQEEKDMAREKRDLEIQERESGRDEGRLWEVDEYAKGQWV